jgi:hypothetical protein
LILQNDSLGTRWTLWRRYKIAAILSAPKCV